MQWADPELTVMGAFLHYAQYSCNRFDRYDQDNRDESVLENENKNRLSKKYFFQNVFLLHRSPAGHVQCDSCHVLCCVFHTVYLGLCGWTVIRNDSMRNQRNLAVCCLSDCRF